MQDGIFYRDGTLLPSKYDRLIKVRQGKTSIKPHVAIDLEDCYFHSRSVAAQYTMGGWRQEYGHKNTFRWREERFIFIPNHSQILLLL